MTEDEFKALKREAWRIKSASGRKHYEVLDDLAQQRGFKDWAALSRTVKVTWPFPEPVTSHKEGTI